MPAQSEVAPYEVAVDATERTVDVVAETFEGGAAGTAAGSLQDGLHEPSGRLYGQEFEVGSQNRCDFTASWTRCEVPVGSHLLCGRQAPVDERLNPEVDPEIRTGC